jgi:predicted transcriptional regulator
MDVNMNGQNEMLDFVKAMSDMDRLRIIGLLAQNSVDREQIVARLKLPLRDVVNHLAFLEHVGAIGQTNGMYELKSRDLERLAHSQLAKDRPAYFRIRIWTRRLEKSLWPT